VAPEVIEMSGACFASDIWSLGCTIVELLTGKPPYADLRESMSGKFLLYQPSLQAVMFRIVKDDMPPLPQGLSGELNDFLQTCFRKDPSSRPAATELFDHVWLKRYCPDLVSPILPQLYVC
jgi:serine/threonine protein kinase